MLVLIAVAVLPAFSSITQSRKRFILACAVACEFLLNCNCTSMDAAARVKRYTHLGDMYIFYSLKNV